jgi:serine protease Do
MLDPVRNKAKIIVFTTAAFLGGVILASGMEWTTGSHAASFFLQQQAPPARAEVQPVADLSDAFIAIAEAVTPAVVNIRTERTQRLPGGHPEMPEPFRRFFRGPPGSGGEAIPQEAGGTGFLISDDGHIMTNNHVVEGADRIRVIMQDRREFDARIIGRDPTTDVAVIRIEGRGFPVVRTGRPESARVGEWVLAIGNPLGLDFTVTAGIISAKGRPLNIIAQTLLRGGQDQAGYAIESFIQTDAAINPGNSGGPLVNLRGEVIGVNSAIASQSGFSEGYGFAIPIDLAQRVADDLIRHGQVRRPILGVSIQEVTVEDAEVYRLPAVAGAVVQDFSAAGSPAERAGMRPGDVIVAIDGQPVTRSNELQRIVASRRPGDRVAVDVIRYGQRQQFQVQLAEAPAPATARAAAAAPPPQPAAEGRLGAVVAPLTAEVARTLQYGEPGGVVITEVTPYGPLGRRNIGRGWKVVRIDQQDIREVQQFERALAARSTGDVVSLTLETPDGARRIVNVRIP